MNNRKKLMLYSATLAILSIIVLIFRDWFIAMDEALFTLVAGMSHPILDMVFMPLTYYGSLFFWSFLVAFTWLRKERKLSLHLVYILIVNSILSISLKWAFQRPRPEGYLKYFILSESDIGKSFPSGHAINAFSGSTVAASFYKHKGLFYGTAILTAISRVYIGAHYPLDVLFGSLIGLIIGTVVLEIPTDKMQKRVEKYSKLLKSKFGIK